MEREHIKNVVCESIKKTGWLSFPQLLRMLDSENIPHVGEGRLEMPDKNLVVWGGLSEDVVLALSELFNTGVVLLFPTSSAVYELDGLPTTFPVTSKISKKPPAEKQILLTTMRLADQGAVVLPNLQVVK